MCTYEPTMKKNQRLIRFQATNICGLTTETCTLNKRSLSRIEGDTCLAKIDSSGKTISPLSSGHRIVLFYDSILRQFQEFHVPTDNIQERVY